MPCWVLVSALVSLAYVGVAAHVWGWMAIAFAVAEFVAFAVFDMTFRKATQEEMGAAMLAASLVSLMCHVLEIAFPALVVILVTASLVLSSRLCLKARRGF